MPDDSLYVNCCQRILDVGADRSTVPTIWKDSQHDSPHFPDRRDGICRTISFTFRLNRLEQVPSKMNTSFTNMGSLRTVWPRRSTQSSTGNCFTPFRRRPETVRSDDWDHELIDANSQGLHSHYSIQHHTKDKIGKSYLVNLVDLIG